VLQEDQTEETTVSTKSTFDSDSAPETKAFALGSKMSDTFESVASSVDAVIRTDVDSVASQLDDMSVADANSDRSER
jgi:hypothetical protein